MKPESARNVHESHYKKANSEGIVACLPLSVCLLPSPLSPLQVGSVSSELSLPCHGCFLETQHAERNCFNTPCVALDGIEPQREVRKIPRFDVNVAVFRLGGAVRQSVKKPERWESRIEFEDINQL